MYLQFILTMPGAASWNGKWSGDGRFYAKTRFLRNDKAGKEQVAKVLEKSPYNYRWPDGWMAQVDVERITSRQAESVRKKSNGLKLLLDALEKAIYDNDRWALPRIQDWSIDKEQPRVEMEIYRGC